MKRSKFLKILGVAAVAPIAVAKAMEGIQKPDVSSLTDEQRLFAIKWRRKGNSQVVDNLIPGGGHVKSGELITLEDGTKIYYTPWHILDDPNFFEKYPIKNSKKIKLIGNKIVFGNYEDTIT